MVSMGQKMNSRKPYSEFRKRAEEVLDSAPEDISRDYPPEEMQKLIHELNVHQIELELQNEELRRSQLELAAARDKYSDLFDFAPVGYLTFDDGGMILEANLTGAAMLGVERGSLIGKPFSTFIAVDSQDAYYLHRRKLFDTKTPRTRELKLKNGKDAEFHGQMECVPVLGDDGNITEIRASLIDISAQKKSEEEKEDLETQIRQSRKMECIGTLTGGIAHHFNNMLGVVLGGVELALDDIPGSNPARESLDEARTACLLAKDAIHQLLGFAHKTDADIKPLRFVFIIKESLKFLRASIPSSIDIRQNLTAKSDVILADPCELNELIINLGVNAAQAMPDGGILEIGLRNTRLHGDTRIHFHSLPPGLYVKLTVSDTGCGINPEIIDKIFDPYYTTKDVGKGTGLGLSIVYGIVNKAGGAISVESEPERGTTFDVFFPVVEKNVKADAELVPELPTGNESILFVDDEPAIVKLTRQRLERLGYKVLGLTNPLEALDRFLRDPNRYDLVITDLTMPKMTGDILAREILDIRADTPIILSSGFHEKMNEERAKEIGAAAFLNKPHEKRDIAEIVRDALDGRVS